MPIRLRQSLLCSLVLLACGSAADPAHAAAAIWQDRQAQLAADTAQLAAPLQEYRALVLDLTGLRTQLADSPDERSTAAPAQISLPMPDGSAQQFNVWTTHVMPPALAARYPQIHTYVARAVQHPEVEARLDDSPLGFAAMIRASDGVILLQPVTRGEGDQYLSFRRSALGATTSGFRCLNDGARAGQLNTFNGTRVGAPAPQTVTGANVRTYRLALAATGEYTATFGGTVATGMAAIVQAVNRINGIYLNEFAVQFQLVNNNDQLVYTNAATDPYTNDDGFAMLGQNQTNVDTIIGAANYDFGHVFSTGGGGVADVAVACNNGSKAQGVTGSGLPTTDGFWVDYVAHEMGHQMGALHSFNSTDGACGGGNRTSGEAAEPGSGSTIMAYAGICAPSDLQPHSDPTFHAISLVPIAAQLAGGGSSCGTVLSTSNHAPVPAAVAPHTIPAQTPFALTGAATDQDGDTLTYMWEQMDLGAASPPESDDGTRPLFRSFVPTLSPTRLFPELPRILAHNLSIGIPSGGNISGETFATTTRALHFRLTVRDNHSGGAATASTDAVVNVSSASGPFRVTAPVPGAQWAANHLETVGWNVANTNAAPVNCSSVDILYSSDGGLTFPALLASAVPNSGSAKVVSPNLASATARIEVACSGNIFFDISAGNFTIVTDVIFKDGFEG